MIKPVESALVTAQQGDQVVAGREGVYGEVLQGAEVLATSWVKDLSLVLMLRSLLVQAPCTKATERLR